LQNDFAKIPALLKKTVELLPEPGGSQSRRPLAAAETNTNIAQTNLFEIK